MGKIIMPFLVDSVILIDHLNDIAPATQFIDRHHLECFLSVITRAEVLVGVPAEVVSSVKQYLDCFQILPITTQDADLASELRRNHKWKLPDALQAALAKNHQLKLATRNTKDFNPSKHRFVHVPYIV
jgi:predicted nucleic acid-binding protein